MQFNPPKRSTSYAQGQSLLEIFYVRVNDIESGRDSGDIYGTITVDDGAGRETIWHRNKGSLINIKSDEDILLEGPSRPLYAADEFYINVELWHHDSDDLIPQNIIAFNPFGHHAKYDVVNNHKVGRDNGSVTVSYMAMNDGLYAQIKVILISGDNDDPVNVYGNITANNGNGESELFRKASDEHVDVGSKQPIPLSRAVVAVPTKNTLIINVTLWWDQDSSGHEIARGSATFQPLYKKSESQYITGAHEKVEVQVTWM